MSDLIWLPGCVAALFLAVVATWLRRWWPLPYVFALMFGIGTGVLVVEWPAPLRSFWWMLVLVYAVALPIGQVIAARRRWYRGLS